MGKHFDMSGAPLPSDDLPMRTLASNLAEQTRRVDDIVRKLTGYDATQVSAFDTGGDPAQYDVLAKRSGSWPGIQGGAISPWPFKVYNKTVTTTGQVQINGGDGSLASLSPTDGSASGVACVNGNPTDTLISGAYPQLSITDNGNIYIATYLNSSGQVEAGSSMGGTGVDVLFTTGAVPASDTSTPPAFAYKMIATITGYATDGLGNVSFMVNDATGPEGVTTVCGGTPAIIS